MKVSYSLSNHQLKELLTRGRPLLLALPLPPNEVTDPADWARSVLPLELRGYVVSAEEQEVRAAPKVCPQGSGPGGEYRLADVLGDIARAERWTVGIACIVARLEHGQPRGSPIGPQWPANVSVDGRQLIQ